jgi:hypothetical protein
MSFLVDDARADQCAIMPEGSRHELLACVVFESRVRIEEYDYLALGVGGAQITAGAKASVATRRNHIRVGSFVQDQGLDLCEDE